MQIHVWLQNGKPVIKIYSKSKRDSTEDRKDTHEYDRMEEVDAHADPSQHNPRQSRLASC